MKFAGGGIANQYYEKIMQLKEADEFKGLVKKWEILSGNIKKHPTNVPIILPDMIWVAKSGVGKTNLLKLMSEYLASKGNLMSFYGDVKFFEFILGYCDPRSEFTEIQRIKRKDDQYDTKSHILRKRRKQRKGIRSFFKTS